MWQPVLVGSNMPKIQLLQKFCPTCGKETNHFPKSGSCVRCNAIKNRENRKEFYDLKFCPKCNKVTKHTQKNGICRSCIKYDKPSRPTYIKKFCEVCGCERNFNRKGKCLSCEGKILNSPGWHEEFCEVCGKLTYQSKYGKCLSCLRKKDMDGRTWPKKYCSVCGEITTHHYTNHDVCMSCQRKEISLKNKSKKYCEICQKETTHSGDSCMTCALRKRYEEKPCNAGGYDMLKVYRNLGIKETNLYIITFATSEPFFKVGISKSLGRPKSFLRRFPELNPKILLLERGDIESICSVEKYINYKMKLPVYPQSFYSDGKTETYSVEYLPEVLEYIDRELNI